MDDLEGRKEELQTIIRRNREIIEGLESNNAWKMVVKDFQKSLDISNDQWQNLRLDDEKQRSFFYELKYNKLSAMAVINVVRTYQDEMDEAKKQLYILENPDKEQDSYIDQE